MRKRQNILNGQGVLEILMKIINIFYCSVANKKLYHGARLASYNYAGYLYKNGEPPAAFTHHAADHRCLHSSAKAFLWAFYYNWSIWLLVCARIIEITEDNTNIEVEGCDIKEYTLDFTEPVSVRLSFCRLLPSLNREARFQTARAPVDKMKFV